MEIVSLGDENEETAAEVLTFKRKCDTIGVEALKNAGDFGGNEDGYRGDSVRGRGDFTRNERKITEMKQGVKNPNRVNIFIDEKFAFSLDVVQVVDFRLKVGKVLSEAELDELRKASEFGKAYQRALEWVLVRPRSERELRDYLWRKERMTEAKERQKEWQMEKEEKKPRKRVARKYDFDDMIVERLKERGYVDDAKFARYYVENRFVKKGVSAKRLKMELAKKGISKEVAEEVLAESGRDETEEIRKMIAKKRARYDDEKLIAYLCRQGFSYELVREMVRSCETD